MRMTRSKWFQPAITVGLGFALLAAMWIGGDLRSGLFSLGAMLVLAAGLALGGRSETIRGLRGDGRDERFARIDLTATAVAGIAVIAVVIVAFLVEVARGQDGSPYAALGAVGGVAYLATVVVLRVRG